MNRYLLKQNIIGLLFFTCLFVGCDNAEYSVLHNQAYISQTGTNPNTALKVFIGDSQFECASFRSGRERL